MTFYQQYNPFNTQIQQKKRIDPQKIFPKRLGTYQNGNALVLQYYNLETDKFKKHVIPIDHSKSAKENVNEIYKNPKHGVLLRKVQMKYIQAVLNGQGSYNSSSYNSQNNYQPQHQASYGTYSSQNSNPSQYQPQQSFPQQYSQPQQFNQSNSATNNNTFKSQNQLSSIIASKSSEYLTEQTKERINEVQEEYEEEFEDYEISQSMGNTKDKGKKSQMANTIDSKKQQHPVNLSINSNTGNNSVSIPLQSKYNNQVSEQVQEKKPKKSKKSKEKKSKKKKQEEYDDFQFDLLDDEGNVPKKPAKEKSKEKSKEKKQKKPEKEVKKAKQVQEDVKPKKKAVQEVIEEDFQFL